MEIQRDAPDTRIRCGIFYGTAHSTIVKGIDYHIDAQRFAGTGRDILLQSFESPLAPYIVVVLPHSVHGHPNRIGDTPVKTLLGVGCDGAGEKAQTAREAAKIVHRLVAIPPDKGLPAFEIHEPRAQRVAVFQLLSYLFVRLVNWRGMIIDAAVLTAQIAAVRDENHTLKRSALSEDGSLEPPPGKVYQLCQ